MQHQPSPREGYVLTLTMCIDKPTILNGEQEVAGVYFIV